MYSVCVCVCGCVCVCVFVLYILLHGSGRGRTINACSLHAEKTVTKTLRDPSLVCDRIRKVSKMEHVHKQLFIVAGQRAGQQALASDGLGF